MDTMQRRVDVSWSQPAILFGLATGMRSMTGLAALCIAGTLGKARPGWAPTGEQTRQGALVLAAGEMMGDKMPFAPDRLVAPSIMLRLVLGAIGGVALAGRQRKPLDGLVSGATGALIGTLCGRAARGASTRSNSDWYRALGEDATAVLVATAALGYATRVARGHHGAIAP